MKKLLALLVMALMASPLFAASTITISAVDAGNGILRVSYTVDATSDSDPVGMALNFASSAGTTVAADVTSVDPLFPVYLDYAHDVVSATPPGTYNFSPVSGSPLAKTDAAGVPAVATQTFAICVGRLGQAAPTKGVARVLCDIKLTATPTTAAYTDVTISADSLRGGVVGSVFTVNVPATPVRVNFQAPECMKSTAPEYNTWVALGKPACWCFKRQCRGDGNNSKGITPFWVNSDDLAAFRLAFNKLDAQLPSGGVCSDYDHSKGITPFRVNSADLTIFRAYFNKLEAQVPICDMTNYNFWN